MDILFKILLALHIIGGGTGLITGAINMSRQKGDRVHKRVGMAFMYGMITAGMMSLILSVIHPSPFLFITGVFSLYLTITGKRYLLYKTATIQQNIKSADWALTISMMLTSIVFICLGIWEISQTNNFGIVFIVFGVFGLLSVRTDIMNYKGSSKIKNYWLTGHLQRMVASYIAAVTAFLVVNWKFVPLALPSYVVWLLPSAILVPLMMIWTRKYQVLKKD